MYVMRPDDLLVLFGLCLIMIRQPFSEMISYASYEQIKKRVPYAIQNPIYFGIIWYTLDLFIATAVFLIFLERASIHTWIAYVEFSLFGALYLALKAWPLLFFTLHDYLTPTKKQLPSTSKQLPAQKSQSVSDSGQIAYLAAFIDIILIFVALMCFAFFAAFADPDYSAGFWVPTALMVPVIVWVAFAGYLNLAAMSTAQSSPL